MRLKAIVATVAIHLLLLYVWLFVSTGAYAVLLFKAATAHKDGLHNAPLGLSDFVPILSSRPNVVGLHWTLGFLVGGITSLVYLFNDLAEMLSRPKKAESYSLRQRSLNPYFNPWSHVGHILREHVRPMFYLGWLLLAAYLLELCPPLGANEVPDVIKHWLIGTSIAFAAVYIHARSCIGAFSDNKLSM